MPAFVIWEHSLIQVPYGPPESLVQALSEVAVDGWELVSVNGPLNGVYDMWLKRPTAWS